MAERMGCIYIITNDINDKVYVGQTLRDLQVRYSEHCYDTRSTSSIHQAIQKYGVSHFNIAVLEYVPFSKLDEREQYWIAHYNSYKNGYNATPGGDGGRTHYLPENEQEKILKLWQAGNTFSEIKQISGLPIYSEASVILSQDIADLK